MRPSAKQLNANAFDITWDGSHGPYYINPPFLSETYAQIVSKIKADKTPLIYVVVPSYLTGAIDKMTPLSVGPPKHIAHAIDTFIPLSQQDSSNPTGAGMPAWDNTWLFVLTGSVDEEIPAYVSGLC